MDNKVYLTDIAGYDEEKAEAKKIIEVLKNHDKYEKLGAYIPKGLILSGNPGVGKTLLAKAIATESGVGFYEFESNESETEAETIKSIKELFKKAKENAPSIVFIDEFDELVMTSDFRSDYSRKTTKILLTEIDGITSSTGVMVIVTTNFRQMLPPALTRNGRMDKRITIEMPDLIDREEIFKLYLSRHDILKKIDAHYLASKTSNFTGADIKTLVNETIIDCASQNKKDITLEDFDRNIPVVMFQNIKKKTRNGSSDITCYHELGHFITRYVLTGEIGSISVEKYGEFLGRVEVEDRVDVDRSLTRNSLSEKLVTCLGGMAAEEVMCNDISCGASNDIYKARKLIYALLSVGAFGFEYSIDSSETDYTEFRLPISENRLNQVEQLISNLFIEAYNKAKKIIADNKPVIELIYPKLKQTEKLSKREISQILDEFKNNGGKIYLD